MKKQGVNISNMAKMELPLMKIFVKLSAKISINISKI